MLRAAILLVSVALLTSGCHVMATGSVTVSTPNGTTTASTTTSADVPSVNLFTSANCKQLIDLSQTFRQGVSGAGGNLDQIATLLRQFADGTPADIRPDFEVLAGAYGQVAASLKGVDLSSPSPETFARIAQAESQLDPQKLATAGAHVALWALRNCVQIH
jgi:hypothetical protein